MRIVLSLILVAVLAKCCDEQEDHPITVRYRSIRDQPNRIMIGEDRTHYVRADIAERIRDHLIRILAWHDIDDADAMNSIREMDEKTQ